VSLASIECGKRRRSFAIISRCSRGSRSVLGIEGEEDVSQREELRGRRG
jgi:hypothetical protein